MSVNLNPPPVGDPSNVTPLGPSERSASAGSAETIDASEPNTAMPAHVDERSAKPLNERAEAAINKLRTGFYSFLNRLSQTAPVKFFNKMDTALGERVARGTTRISEKILGTEGNRTKVGHFVSEAGRAFDKLASKLGRGPEAEVLPSLPTVEVPPSLYASISEEIQKLTTDLFKGVIRRQDVKGLPASNERDNCLQAFNELDAAVTDQEQAQRKHDRAQQKVSSHSESTSEDLKELEEATEELAATDIELTNAHEKLLIAWSELAAIHPDKINPPLQS